MHSADLNAWPVPYLLTLTRPLLLRVSLTGKPMGRRIRRTSPAAVYNPVSGGKKIAPVRHV
ncbi:MAG: hypothetical protein V3T62_07445, partial [Alphaproteobacteria bacterium]